MCFLTTIVKDGVIFHYNMRLTWSLTLLIVSLSLSLVLPKDAGAAGCQSSVSDTFGNLDKWTVANVGSTNTATVGNFFGKQAVRHTYSDPAGHILMTYDLCQSTFGRVIIDFYDDGTTNKGTLVTVTSPTNEVVGVGLKTNLYGTFVYRVHSGFSPDNSTITAGVRRTTGWHRLELVATPVGAYGMIDGINLTWANGKKTSEGFSYNINTGPGFLANGFKTVNLVSTWGLTSNNYFANLRFEPLPSFTYTDSTSSMAQLSNEIARFYLAQYPHSVNANFYDQILSGGLGGHELAQEYNHIALVAALLAADYRKTGNGTSLSQSVALLQKVVNSNFDTWKNCNSTPYAFTNILLAARLVWDKLDQATKNRVVQIAKAEAGFWMTVNLSSTNALCTNPWGSTRAHLPFQRAISATDSNLMNSATRDNAWMSAFFNLMGNFGAVSDVNPPEGANYRTLAQILGYHSLVRQGDPGYGVHPAFPGEGTVAAARNLLDNFNNPTVWANPNPFYSYITPQQIIHGLLPYIATGNISTIGQEYFHNWRDTLARADIFINFATARSVSSVENPAAVSYMPNDPTTPCPTGVQACRTSFDLFGKGHQNEDLTVQAGTLAGLAVLPQSQTGVDQAIARQRLFTMLKYEFYTLSARPRMPWYPDGTAGGASVDNQTIGTTTTVGPMDGWGTWRPEQGIVTPTTHLNMLINGVVAMEHLYANLLLDPTLYCVIRTDTNCDSWVGKQDLSVIFSNWSKGFTSDSRKNGDVNSDSKVNAADFGWWVKDRDVFL